MLSYLGVQFVPNVPHPMTQNITVVLDNNGVTLGDEFMVQNPAATTQFKSAEKALRL